jgi:uroporphyrinogen decarboxylase
MASDAKLLRTLAGETSETPPIWLMRQAGRYLPEYRELRASVSGFMELCMTPKLAAEVTIQPIRRFGFDAAILFSDILVVPHAFGLSVDFLEGEGPQVKGLFDDSGAYALGRFDLHRLDFVFETLGLIKPMLGPETALIGFCGAPFTVASYMVAGHSSPDQAEVRLFAYRHPEKFAELIERLVEASVDYLVAQAQAGAQVVQIFDSWAGVLPPDQFVQWSARPIAEIVTKFQARAPGVPVIAFPREAGSKLPLFLETVPQAAIGVGTGEALGAIARLAGPSRVLQGNLDPLALIAGGPALEREVDEILSSMRGKPFVFNLGHGILPPTPIEHVQHLLKRVRGT